LAATKDRDRDRPIVIAYADPPYPGQARRRYACDEIDHRKLVTMLVENYPDGWALSTSSPALHEVLPLCPPTVRIGAWVKPFAVYKPGVNPAYAWEPVLYTGGRKRDRTHRTVRDWVSCNITLRRGLCGAKPEDFCRWLFALMGLRPGDHFVDLFPGSGAVTTAWRNYVAECETELKA
jgi:hypothetical protein